MTLHKLNANEILDDTAKKLELEQYVDDGLRQRFIALVEQFNVFGSIDDQHLPGALEQFGDLVGYRLKLARDWDRHPEILNEKVTQPFFVVGNARAGTTFAQTLLTLDEGHRTPRYWEVRHPSPPPGLDPTVDAASMADEDEYAKWILQTSPRLLSSHPYLEQLGRTEAEDEYLYVLDFHMAYPLSLLKVPNLPQAVPPTDPVAAMKFHKRILQQFQWKMPTKRWVGKGIVHQYIAPAVLEAYPDAVCFWMHRAPEDYIPSLLELLEVQYKPFNGELYRVDPQDMVAQLRAGVDHILNAEVLNDPRIHHIRFGDLVRDPAAVFADVYAKSGIRFTDQYRQRLQQHIKDPANKADRHGKFTYDPKKFGITREGLRATFADYCERFGL
jgi:hypothetical protein